VGNNLGNRGLSSAWMPLPNSAFAPGYDIITLQKLIEREYSIPEPQTAEEVIGYYARRIAQEVKILS
jgi:hypothetical protein